MIAERSLTCGVRKWGAMTPEDELVAAADGGPGPLSPAAIALAERERLAALFGDRAWAPAAWKAETRRTLVHAIHAQDLTSRWVASLPVPVVLLKGIALAELVYDSPAERPMGDVDLLVPPDRWQEACAAAPGEELVPPGRPLTARHDYCRSFRHRSGLVVEIHRWLTPRPLWPGDPTALLARARRRQDGAYLLAPEDLLLSLCVHAAKHGFVVGLRAVIDTRRVVQRLAPDPMIVAARARAWSATRATEMWLTRCGLSGFLGRTRPLPRGGRLIAIVRAGDSPRQGLAYLAHRIGFRAVDAAATLLGRS